VLVGCFFVIEHASNSGILFIFLDFLLKNFQFKLHEVNLLLKILNVLFVNVLLQRILLKEMIGVLSYRLIHFLILTMEIHVYCAIIFCFGLIVSKGLKRFTTLFQSKIKVKMGAKNLAERISDRTYLRDCFSFLNLTLQNIKEQNNIRS
jgi:hypothetical protein